MASSRAGEGKGHNEPRTSCCIIKQESAQRIEGFVKIMRRQSQHYGVPFDQIPGNLNIKINNDNSILQSIE